MTENSEIKKLLNKHILNQCTAEEIEKVVDYYRNGELTPDFPLVEDIKLMSEPIPEMDKATAEKIFSNVLASAKEIEQAEIIATRNPYRKYMAIAASILVLVSIGIFYKN